MASRRYRLAPVAEWGIVWIIPMHELGIMESTLDAVMKAARENGARRVHRIVLRVGALSGAEPAALRFAFGIAARGTPAEEAVLDIDTVPARARCADCGIEFEAGADFITAWLGPVVHRV